MERLVENIRDRLLKKNQNWLAVVCGPTGSGKSMAALTLAREIDPGFDLSRVVFTPTEFIALLNSGKLKTGDAIVFDEAGAGIPARAWMSISNKVLNLILQTFRRENLAVIFTVPNLSYIDSQARGLLHAYLETIRIDRQAKCVVVKWLNVQVNPRFGKPYMHYPRYMTSEGPVITNHVKVGWPGDALVAEYEVKKKRFADQLKADVELDLRALKSKTKTTTKYSPEEISRKVLANPEAYPVKVVASGPNQGKRTVDVEALAQAFKVGRSYAARAKALIEASIT